MDESLSGGGRIWIWQPSWSRGPLARAPWLNHFSMPSATSVPNLVHVDDLREQWGVRPHTTAKTAFLDSGHIGIGGIRGPDAQGYKY